MDIGRILKHLAMTPWQINRAFPAASLTAIERAIAAGETAHGGEIRFAVEGALATAALLRGLSARQRAVEVFASLGVWDTEDNNGVLIYLLLADRDVEIVADRGIAARVGPQEWESICRRMEDAFRQGEFEAGVVAGIQEVSRRLAVHFPPRQRCRDELPDRPALL